MKNVFILIILSIFLNTGISKAISLEEAVNSKNRTKNYVLRDKYRNPLETLSFFKIKNNMKIIELQPSGGNSPRGLLIAAHFNPKESEWKAKFRKKFELQIKNEIDYNKIVMSTLSMPPKKLAESNTVDMVITFRNLHNWLKSGYLMEVFQVSFDALKPGGIFGVVEHRAPKSFSTEKMISSGYVTEKLAIDLAKKVGFILEGKSEINSNPKDTKLHPKGVWTLPPTLKLEEQDKNKYLEIGESDRMTLRFRKPI